MAQINVLIIPCQNRIQNTPTLSLQNHTLAESDHLKIGVGHQGSQISPELFRVSGKTTQITLGQRGRGTKGGNQEPQ